MSIPFAVALEDSRQIGPDLHEVPAALSDSPAPDSTADAAGSPLLASQDHADPDSVSKQNRKPRAKPGSGSQAWQRAARTFGGRLRELRRAAGLTQVQLAERCGMHYQAVAQLERGPDRSAPKRGAAGPVWGAVVALAAALGVQVTDFLPDDAGTH